MGNSKQNNPTGLQVSGWYTLVIFTASMQEYADPVIDWLDAGRGILGRRLFREVSRLASWLMSSAHFEQSCTQLPSGSYTKDLSIVEQDLSRVCLVDNSPVSYSVNQGLSVLRFPPSCSLTSLYVMLSQRHSNRGLDT